MEKAAYLTEQKIEQLVETATEGFPKEQLMETTTKNHNKVQLVETDTVVSNKVHIIETDTIAANKVQLVETDTVVSNKVHIIETDTIATNKVQLVETDTVVSNKVHIIETDTISTNKVKLVETDTLASNKMHIIETAVEDSNNLHLVGKTATQNFPKMHLLETATHNNPKMQLEDPTQQNTPKVQFIAETAAIDSSTYQYVLPLGQELQEDHQLAVELTSEDGVKYLYILSDGISEQKISIDTGKITNNKKMMVNSASDALVISRKSIIKQSEKKAFDIGVASVEPVDKLEDKNDLKQIEDRSCGTMTEEIYMEAEPDDIKELQHETVNKQAGAFLERCNGKQSLLNNSVIHKVTNTTFDKDALGMIKKYPSMNGVLKSRTKSKEPQVTIMNEMKVMGIDKSQDAEVIGNQASNTNSTSILVKEKPKTEEREKYIIDEENLSDDSQTSDEKRNEGNDPFNDLIQLDNVDDETCKEILATIENVDELKEKKNEKPISDKYQNLRVKYEKPRTRNGSKFQRKENIVDMKNVKNGQKRKMFGCDKCDKVYLRKKALSEHLKCHSDKTYPCALCSKNFNSKKKLSNHIKRHSTEQPHLCDICGKAFRVKETYQNHMYTHSDKDEKPFKCEVCGIAFIKQYYLTRHATCHTGVKPFKCKECNKRFRTNGDLQRHDRLHGEKPEVKQFKCDICGKRYCAESGLLRHERSHKGEKPFVCEKCSKSFAMPGDLKRHVKTHYGGDYFPCNLCSKVLTSAVGFKRHQRMHSGEKPYSCKICNDRFIDLWGLTKHQRLHKQYSSEKISQPVSLLKQHQDLQQSDRTELITSDKPSKPVSLLKVHQDLKQSDRTEFITNTQN